MFSINPRADQFNLIIPPTFFIKSITDKYDEFLKQKPTVLNTIQDVLQESIKSFESPEFGFNLKEQLVTTDGGYSYPRFLYPSESEQLLAQKTFQIVFRHTNGYLTYFMMLEHLFYYYTAGNQGARKPWGTVILEMKLPGEKIVVCRIKFRNCKLSGMPNLSLDYSINTRDLSTFAVTFGYDEFETSFETPKLLLKP